MSGTLARWSLAAIAVGVLCVALPDVSSAAPGGSGKAEKKRQLKCKRGQALVKVGRRRRCQALPPAARTDTPEAAMLRELITRDLGVLRVRGRRVKPIWSVGGGRLRRVRTKLLRSLPQIMAFVQRPVARAAVRVPGDPPACPTSGRTETASFDGFDMSIAGNGDVSMKVSASGGYVIHVFIGGALRCSDLDLPACPTAAGKLDGTDGRRTALGLRITQDGDLVQSVRSTVRSTQRLAGEVADDAKVERVAIEDTATETTDVRVPDAAGTITLSVRRKVTLGRGDAIIAAPDVKVGFAVRGLPRADGAAAARRAQATYEDSFGELIRDERAAYTRRDDLWQTPGRCAKLTFSQATDKFPVRPGQTGSVTPTVEANAGGAAAKARWTLTGQEHGTFTPGDASGPSPAISYRVTGFHGQRMVSKFRATSTAGVAEDPWGQRIDDPPKYYRVTRFVYRDDMSLSGLSPMGSCTPSATQHDDTTLAPSGTPYDGEIGPLGGERIVGYLVAQGNIAVSAHYNGCATDDGTTWTPCTDNGSGVFPTALGVNPSLPLDGPATVTWHPLPPVVEYLPTPGSDCDVKGGDTVDPRAPGPIVTTVPREFFLEPGEHTISLDITSDLPAFEEGTVHSVAHYELTFLRVNADGSPYAG